MTAAIFSASEAASGSQLWETDGTSAGTFQFTSVSGGLVPQNFVDLNGTLFFLASDASVNMMPGMPILIRTDWELWQTNGPTSEPTKVTNFSFSSAGSLTNINGELYFAAPDANGLQLWKSDGTASGTEQLSNNVGFQSISQITESNGTIFFETGDQIWKSDGTVAGTVPVIGSTPGLGDIVDANGVLFFETGNGIWKTDGTPNGTVELAAVSDIPGGDLTPVNGTVFFVVQPFDGIVHSQLWKSDGTVAGTGMVIDFGYGSSIGSDVFKGANGLAFFSAFTSQGEQLWRSDGTAGGTVMLTDVDPSTGGLGISNLIEYNHKLYFFGRDAAHGVQLWDSDGTSGGTAMVTDINATVGRIGFSLGSVLSVLNGKLYFEAADAIGGTEFWTSDGTGIGTVMYDDVAGLFTQSAIVSLPNVGASQPVIDVSHSVLSGVVSELSLVTGSGTLDHAAGSIAFIDPNPSSRPTASVVSQTVVYQDSLGHIFPLTADQGFTFKAALEISGELANTNAGTVDWLYGIPDSALDFIGVGESVIVTSTIQVDDHHGGMVNQDVTVTINGANDLPVPLPDVAVTKDGGTVTADAAHGVRSNDSDPDIHDVLRVIAVNGSNANVGHTLHGAYGNLLLSSDGSYTYVVDKNVSIPSSQGHLQDHFSYSVTDGHGTVLSSSLDVTILSQQDFQQRTTVSGGAILDDAIGHLTTPTHNEVWGNFNCTGFVYSVSYETNSTDGFFDPTYQQTAWVGPFGSDNKGPILNTQDVTDSNDPNFFVPIGYAAKAGAVAWNPSDGSNTIYLNPDVAGDGWHLVGKSAGTNSTIIDAADPSTAPQPGDIFRGVIDEKDGSTLIVHSGIVSAYDASTDSIWLISNVRSGADEGNAPITYDRFFLDQSGHSRDVAGPFTIYRLDSASANANDTIVGGSIVDHLGGGIGDDTITGKAGADQLWGGSGNDHFVFNAKTDGLDQVMDFSTGDTLDFSRAAFGNHLAISGGNTGVLDSSHFIANATGPTNAAQEFWYNTSTHILYYDADGSGSGTSNAMAQLANGFVLHSADIHLI